MKSNEFYTPSHIIEIARACMGGIDLDPASCAIANETVKASRFYDTRQNGLKRPWLGRVWLNPPYGRFGPAFVRRAADEFKSGRIEQVIIELNIQHIANGWFSDAMQVEHAICLMRKRIAHYSSVNSISSAKTGSVLIGLGVDRQRFEEFFSPLGKIAFVAA